MLYKSGSYEISDKAHESLQKIAKILQDYKDFEAVSYTHLRAHETVLDLVCRLLLEKKNKNCRDIDFQVTTDRL